MAIHHVVFLKFKTDAKKADIDLFVEELNKIPEMNREVKNWISGYSPEPKFHSGDFDFGMAGDLEDWDAMDRYMYHESHMRMVAFTDVVDYMLSFDFETDYAAPKRFPARKKVPKPRLPRLSKGNVRVPMVSGRQLKDAARVLEEVGLKVGSVEEMIGHVWAQGRVAGQVPDSGTVVEKGSSVDLTVTGEYWMKP